jgi:Tfp pilus assembly protein PilE
MLRYLNPAYYLNTKSRHAYTIDQTILIVAIIAILITLIIVTIGWQLINRTSGTKLGSQLSQLETAISQFYSNTKSFPHQAFSTAPSTPATGYALVLAGVTPSGGTLLASAASNLTNLVNGFEINGTTNLQNSFGGTVSLINTGSVANWVAGAPAASQYIAVQLTNVPLSDAQEADRAIDRAIGNNAGQVVYTAAANCLPTAGNAVAAISALATSPATVTLCYLVSPIN